jgi:hypothetical protein
MGREEEDVIGPWLEGQRAAHPRAWLEGPVPPDSMWVRPGRAFRGGCAEAEAVQAADAYLAMYHDQVRGAEGGRGRGAPEAGRRGRCGAARLGPVGHGLAAPLLV